MDHGVRAMRSTPVPACDGWIRCRAATIPDVLPTMAGPMFSSFFLILARGIEESVPCKRLRCRDDELDGLPTPNLVHAVGQSVGPGLPCSCCQTLFFYLSLRLYILLYKKGKIDMFSVVMV